MLSGFQLKLSKAFLIPQRYVLGIMGFLALVLEYAMRVSLSLAITEMVKPLNRTEHHDSDACTFSSDSHATTNATTPTTANSEDLYDWDQTTQGVILGAFYWGYFVTHMPGGILAEKLGGKYTLALGVLCSALFNFFTPIVVTATGGSAAVLIGVRIFEGLGEGTTYPALNALLAKWVPLGERAKIGTLVFAGAQMGTIIGNLLGGQLIQATEFWGSVFYLFGGCGITWFILFILLCYSGPESHPFITDKEKDFLKTELHSVSNKKLDIPWKGILTSVPLWALVAAQIGHDYGLYTLITELPLYMNEILKFDIAQNGLWSSIPYMVMWSVSMSSGFLCDWLIEKKIMSITFSRKFFTAIAAIFPGIFMIVASYSGCNRAMAVSMFIIGTGFMGTFYCGMKVNALDLSPNFAGTLMAIVNGIGAITGIVAPYLAGALTPDHTLAQWRTVFWICFAIYLITSVIYTLFASGEEQWWNDPDNFKLDGIVLSTRKSEAPKRIQNSE